MNRFFIFLFFLITGLASAAQSQQDSVPPLPKDSLFVQDSIHAPDSLHGAQTDSIPQRVLADSSRPLQPVLPYSIQPLSWSFIKRYPGNAYKPVKTETFDASIHEVNGKELLFYLVVFLVIVFALLKRTFPKYFNDLFRLFFRTTLKQKQVREQLMQTPLPSFLLNGFFVLCGGLYGAFLLEHYDIDSSHSFWLMFLYCCLGLAAAYFIKFAGLKICGWLFNAEEAADSYIFIVFVINKMIGILLLPFLVLLAFSLGDIYSVSLILSLSLVGGLLAYRFILTYAAVRNQVKVNLFHFFLYLCAFEIAPLLLAYKALLIFFRQTT